MKNMALLIIVVMLGFGVMRCATTDSTKISSDPKVYFQLGNNHAKAGRHEKAIEAYKQAINLKSDYAEAHYNLGIACYNLGRNEEAIKAYKQAIALIGEISGA